MENKNTGKEPIVFKQCRACGGTEFFLEEAFKEVVEQGKLPTDTASRGLLGINSGFAIATQSKMLTGLPMSAFVFVIDACKKCGTVIALKVTETEVMPQAVMPPPQMPGRRPGQAFPFKLPPGVPPDGNFQHPAR